jgi:hypothetical protein
MLRRHQSPLEAERVEGIRKGFNMNSTGETGGDTNNRNTTPNGVERHVQSTRRPARMMLVSRHGFFSL